MKKLILITGILLSTNLWANPEETQCKVESYNDTSTIRGVCDKNGIIMFRNLDPDWAHWTIADYCRFDRHIHLKERIKKENNGREKLIVDVTCVLYDNVTRSQAKRK
tara:strand:+ start:101 stop:421 length:321 start_codon:yes stop_codon:yes gene_type:complete